MCYSCPRVILVSFVSRLKRGETKAKHYGNISWLFHLRYLLLMLTSFFSPFAFSVQKIYFYICNKFLIKIQKCVTEISDSKTVCFVHAVHWGPKQKEDVLWKVRTFGLLAQGRRLGLRLTLELSEWLIGVRAKGPGNTFYERPHMACACVYMCVWVGRGRVCVLQSNLSQ